MYSIGNKDERENLLRQVLLDGPKWEPSSGARLQAFFCANVSPKKKPKKFKKKRLGARKVRDMEKLQSVGEKLNDTEATAYRALAARANYLTLDRPDTAFTTKELCRDFASPTRSAWTRLKRLLRYLSHHRRLVWYFRFQPTDAKLQCHVDTDFAGCKKTRRSTSGGCIRNGSHLLMAWSSTQSTVALSSGEAELGGICKGASKALGLRSLAQDLGFDFQLEILTDATAAIGICKMRGLGKIRHLAVADLWVQDRVRAGDYFDEGTRRPEPG